jgi:hypothetical protein
MIELLDRERQQGPAAKVARLPSLIVFGGFLNNTPTSA